MAMIGSDGLNLLMGDGAVSEVFNPLKGASIKRLEITQRLHTANAIRDDAWQQQAGTSERKAVIECEAYATDDAAALRLRSLAMGGDAGNIRLAVSQTQILEGAIRVSRYEETITPGDVKRLSFRLESTGSVSLMDV